MHENCKLMTVTPELAKKFLERNAINRRVRERTVLYLAQCIKNGEFKLTHQTLCFGKSGRLLDGQHRLHAIIKADVPVDLFVFFNMDDDTFDVIDSGLPRSDSDRTSLDKNVISCVKFFIGFIESESSCCRAITGKVSPDKIRSYFEVIEEPFDALMKACPTTARIFSSAPSRCAALSQILLGNDKGYILDLYRNLVLSNTGDLPPIGESIIKQVLCNKITLESKFMASTFTRFLIAFDESNANKRNLILKNEEQIIVETRQKLKAIFDRSTTTQSDAHRVTDKSIGASRVVEDLFL